MMRSLALCRLAAIHTLLLILAVGYSSNAVQGLAGSAPNVRATPPLVYSSKPTVQKPTPLSYASTGALKRPQLIIPSSVSPLPNSSVDPATGSSSGSGAGSGSGSGSGSGAGSGSGPGSGSGSTGGPPRAIYKSQAVAPVKETTSVSQLKSVPTKSPPSTEELVKQARDLQPGLTAIQSGPNSLSYNNHVSNIKIGNNERQDYNLVNNIVAPTLPTNRGYFQNPFERFNQKPDEEDQAQPDQFRDPNEYDDGDYTVYEEQAPAGNYHQVPYFSGYGANKLGGSPGKTCDHESQRNPPKKAKSFKQQLKKAKKQKAKPTQEQLNLKEELLDLVSKATGESVESEEDVPLLKFNRATGKYEAVHSDPNVNVYKEKLRKALEVLNPRKLPTKKLRRVLNEDPLGEESAASEEVTDISPKGMSSAYLTGQNRYDRSFNDNQDVPLETLRRHRDGYIQNRYDQQQQQPAAQGYYTHEYNTYYNEPEAAGSGAYDVRAVLDDSLNRVSDLLYFRPEFLNQLLSTSDDELSPLESEFKRFILCKEDEQFCNHQQQEQEQQERLDGSGGDAYQNYRDEVGGLNQQEPLEESQLQYGDPSQQQYALPDQSSSYYNDVEPQYHHMPSQQPPPDEQQLVEQQPADLKPEQQQQQRQPGDKSNNSKHFSRISSQNSYTYQRSTDGARNGAPLKPQEEHYSQQSSYFNTNNRPAITGAARTSLPGSGSGQVLPAPQQQQQQQQNPRYQPAAGNQQERPSRAPLQYNNGLVAPASNAGSIGASSGLPAAAAAPGYRSGTARASPPPTNSGYLTNARQPAASSSTPLQQQPSVSQKSGATQSPSGTLTSRPASNQVTAQVAATGKQLGSAQQSSPSSQSVFPAARRASGLEAKKF